LVEEEESTGAEGEIIQVICWMPPSQKLIFWWTKSMETTSTRILANIYMEMLKTT
jgi:hypothetical protein